MDCAPAMDPKAAHANHKRLMTIAGMAGFVGAVVGSVLAILVGRRSGGDSKSKSKVVFSTPGTALSAGPAMCAVSLLAGLKLSPAPKRLQRVIGDVIERQ